MQETKEKNLTVSSKIDKFYIYKNPVSNINNHAYYITTMSNIFL